MEVPDILINDFNYHLTDEKIAKFPLEKRGNSKLLIFKNKKVISNKFENLHDFLEKNFLLIFNNTKVIQARLVFQKKTGAKIEIFCLEPFLPYDFSLSFSQRKSVKWKCIIGNLKKWKSGKLKKSGIFEKKNFYFYAEILERNKDFQIIEFTWDNNLSFAEILEFFGKTPLPPYLNRKAEEKDKIRYQTVYSKEKGSVAAPTAGLHFTDEILKKLSKKGVLTEEITLHVGAGTFKPVKTENVKNHKMHKEHFFVEKKVIIKIIENIENIIAVGTTSLRTIESLYFLGIKISENKNLKNFHISQWEAYNVKNHLDKKSAILEILNFLEKNNLEKFEVTTEIIITPNYELKIAKALITNFHQPKSTLLMLIASFVGSEWKKIYKFALENNFRFLSYGDSSLIFNEE